MRKGELHAEHVARQTLARPGAYLSNKNWARD